MPLWARVMHEGRECFGTVEREAILLHEGDMFADPRRTGESIAWNDATLLTPTAPARWWRCRQLSRAGREAR